MATLLQITSKELFK